MGVLSDSPSELRGAGFSRRGLPARPRRVPGGSTESRELGRLERSCSGGTPGFLMASGASQGCRHKDRAQSVPGRNPLQPRAEGTRLTQRGGFTVNHSILVVQPRALTD